MSAISSIADAISNALGIAKPLVDDATTQKYEKAHQNRISELQGILLAPDSDSRANALSGVTKRLLDAAGYPTSESGVSDVVRIPVSDFLGLFAATSEKIKDDALLAKYEQKVTST